MAERTCVVEWCDRAPGSDGQHCKSHRDYLLQKGHLPQRASFYDERKRLHCRVEKDANGCWLWTGCLKESGYGVVRFRRRDMVAHRAMWLLERGDIPAGLDLDHLCRVRRCVNPEHLEPVTRTVNLRRGVGTRATETHCANGHLWADDNERRHLTDGSRVCATCQRTSAREYQRRRRARANMTRQRVSDIFAASE